MSRVERKEYQETKVMRTMSPVRTRSTQNLAEFDQNLDYLLEDLQSSVSRPGSSLGQTGTNTYRDSSRTVKNYDSSARSNSLNRITNVKPQNTITDYSSDDAYNYTSPDGTKKVQTFKKETYSYKTNGTNVAPEKLSMKNNINQLDSLLDDLQQVKQSSVESRSYNSVGASPTFGDQKSTTTHRNVQRELHYGDTPPRSSSRTRTLERSDRENSVTRDVEYLNEGNYGDLRSPSRSSTLSKQTKVTNVHSYPTEVVNTTTPDINPEILANLDPTLLPAGNTKVTTTIKTYTYEIPGSGYPSSVSPTLALDTEKYVYSPNESATTPSKSFIYNKHESNTNSNTLTRNVNVNVHDNYNVNSNTSPVIRETVTTRNYQPGVPPTPQHDQTYIYNESSTTTTYDPQNAVQVKPYPTDWPGKNTYMIKETTHNNTTNTVNQSHPPRGHTPSSQPHHETYIIKESHNTTNTVDNSNYQHHYPPQNTTTVIHKEPLNYPTNQPSKNMTVLMKRDTHTTNVIDRGDNRPYPAVETFDPNYPNTTAGPGRPGEPINVTYKYSSHSRTTKNYKGQDGPEREPLLPPTGKFPTDGHDIDGPPKRLDDLMAKIGHEPPNSALNAGYNQHEAELIKQRKVDSLKQQHEDIDRKEPVKDLQRTKNVTGPPVYYPPGHEMFAKKEEAGAWRAEGAMAKESGKYKYEAESKSKSKSMGGAAIVPVCLPLCCGLPCTIL